MNYLYLFLGEKIKNANTFGYKFPKEKIMEGKYEN